MSISTFSVFYYGFEVDQDNKYLCFDEGSGELIAEIATGSYTPTQLASAVKTALDTAGDETYTVSFDRNSRKFTISATATVTLKVVSGSTPGQAYDLLGFTGSDRTAAASYTGNVESGSQYFPQFILQDYVDKTSFKRLIDPSINVAADGTVEVVRFGTAEFFRMNFKFITNRAMDGKVIKNNPQGLEDFQAFMNHLINKKPLEFMADVSDRNTFETLILESNEFDRNGTGYRLKELYDRGLPDIYESGPMEFRVVG